jgi:hypothetical protein
MSEDERIDEIKRLLEGTMEEFDALLRLAGGFEDVKVGSGWRAPHVSEKIYVINPIPADQALEIGESNKRRLFGAFLFRPKPSDIKIIGEPTLRFIPYWTVKGFHECFYFRGNLYRVNVPDDVIAVEVEGKVRNLIAEGESQKSLVEDLKKAVRRIRSLLPSKRKYFVISDVTELAHQYAEGFLCLNANGRDDNIEELLKENPPLQEVSDPSELKMNNASVQVIQPLQTKEDVICKLHEKIVKPPKVFNKILINRFEITRLAVYYVPYYIIKYYYKGNVKEMKIHGVTGKIIE